MPCSGFLARNNFDSLIEAIHAMDMQCLGPTVRDGAIVYAAISSAKNFPQGIQDQQSPGHYQITKKDHRRWFNWANGPQALKPIVFAPDETLWRVERDGEGRLQFTHSLAEIRPTAVIGVRACDIAALALQDQHFLQGAVHDGHYARRREHLFIIAVNCSHPAESCFCHATGDGPEVKQGFDLLLDELDDGFIVQAGSDGGEQVIKKLPLEDCAASRYEEANRAKQSACERQLRTLPDVNLQEVLYSKQASPRWKQVAERCLSCGNCTSVCPTCFCHRSFDQPSADAAHSLHVRQWDSCFTQGHSYIHGFTLRSETRFRYRQWLTHKFAAWIDQYGRSGCVGCGRCISWCPVGIDVTEELQAIATEQNHAE